MNVGLLCLHLFLGGLCFFFSCLFSEQKKLTAVPAAV